MLIAWSAWCLCSRWDPVLLTMPYDSNSFGICDGACASIFFWSGDAFNVFQSFFGGGGFGGDDDEDGHGHGGMGGMGGMDGIPGGLGGLFGSMGGMGGA